MPKVTSLSAQLKRLQVPQSSLLAKTAHEQGGYRRVSFLYDPKEAANLDSESVYCIGLNGLEQLKLIDRQTFESFELTLFSASNITFERAIQTKDANEKLNAELRRFFVHLAPYFMLKPAHKALEWLVFRYKIHLYNVNELFMCILPYHETNYFVRALQMLSLDDSAVEHATSVSTQLWSWLVDNQKRGIQLASSTLATHLFSDLTFFNFIIDFLNQCLAEFSQGNENHHYSHGLDFVFGFLTKLFLQSIKQLDLVTNTTTTSKKNFNNKQQEAFFAQLLPILFTGLRSDVIQFKQLAYLTLAYLFEKFKFNTSTVNKALFGICKGLSMFRTTSDDGQSSECVKSAVLTMCLLVQSQYDESDEQNEDASSQLMNSNFIGKLLKNFSSKETLLLSTLDDLNGAYRIEKFLKCFLTRLMTVMVDEDAANQVDIKVDLDANDDENELEQNEKNTTYRLLVKLLNVLNLNHYPQLIEHLTTHAFDLLVRQLELNRLPNLYIEYHLCELIFRLESKYPVLFDKCLSRFLDSATNTKLTKRTRTYLLNTISFKFNSFKCKLTFKYQQIGDSDGGELNLLTSLANSNASVRANALRFILNELDNKRHANKFNVDRDFIRNELDAKFKHESSTRVYKQLLEFNVRLLDYFTLSELLTDRLTAVFTPKDSGDPEWLECRQMTLELVFNDLYAKFTDKKEDFFDAYLRISTAVFSLTSTTYNLMDKLKKSTYYLGVQSEIHANENASPSSSPIKKFYPTAKFYSPVKTPSATNGNHNNNNNHANNNYSSDTDTDSEGANDLFEQFLQTSVKYMLATSRKTTIIQPPVTFDRALSKVTVQAVASSKLALIDLVVLEICTRLCAQSLFFKNPAYFFNLASLILTNLLGSATRFNLKVKNTKDADDDLNNKRYANSLTNFKYTTSRQSLKHFNLLQVLFVNLYRSLAIQISNFVNGNSNVEIEKCLNRIYVYLCAARQEYKQFGAILDKLTQSSCFINAHSTSTQTPTKLTTPTANPATYTFYQFSFKFLIDYGLFNDGEHKSATADELNCTQLETVRLYQANLDEFIEMSRRRTDDSMLNSVLLALTWCLTSENRLVRTHSLRLIESIGDKLSAVEADAQPDPWTLYIKKLLKHKQEIEIDGQNYVRSKSINKIFSASEELSAFLIQQFVFYLNVSLTRNNLKPHQVAQFSSNEDTTNAEQDTKCLVLMRFKYILLNLFAQVREEVKLKLLETVFNLLVANLNESSSLIVGEECQAEGGKAQIGRLVQLNRSIVALVADAYLLNKRSYDFFNSNEKHFDYLIGYLNNNNQSASAQLVRHFKQCFMSKLARENERIQFFQLLDRKMQSELLKCAFDMLQCNSASSFESSLVTSELIQENIVYLNSIRDAFSSFQLNAEHFVCLINDKASLEIVNAQTDQANAVNSTKEMRKQLAAKANGSEKKIEWKSLKLVLELLQTRLLTIENENNDAGQSTGSGQDQKSNLIDLVAYLFLILETIETKFLLDSTNKSATDTKSTEENVTSATTDKDYLYVEQLCLNSLLSIYRTNKQANKAKLDSAKFNIELLMQILQTKLYTDNDDEEHDEEQDSCARAPADEELKLDRLNIQQTILILLSEIASIFPDKVLEHVLIMFVFVGNKLTRKDDSYSFQIINQIIKSILPSIVASCNEVSDHTSQTTRLTGTANTLQRHQKQLPYVSSLVCKILQSFVVALPHIPAHRKTVIFENLMRIVGLNDYLWITLVQSIDHYLVQSQDLLEFKTNLEEFTHKQKQYLADRKDNDDDVSKSEKKLRDTLQSCLESMISLYVQFEPGHIVQSLVYLITFLNKYLGKLFDKASELKSKSKSNDKKIYSHLACQLDDYNLLQMKYLAYNMLTFANEILNSEELIAKLSVLYEAEHGAAYSELFENLIEKILLLILKLSQTRLVDSDSDIHKFHKSIVNKSYDLMEKTINLLDSKQFLTVVNRLIKHDLIQIRRRALVMLNGKLRKSEPDERDVTLLIALIDDLLASINLEQTSAAVDVEINNQTVLFCIKLMCKRIGEQNPLAFVKVMKYLSDHLIDRSLYLGSDSTSSRKIKNLNLLSSVLLCAGEVCQKLKSNSLVYLNQIITFDLDIVDYVRVNLEALIRLQGNDHDELLNDFNEQQGLAEQDKSYKKFAKKFKNYELLMLSCVTCLQKITHNMANFVSPYLHRLIYVCCSLSHLTSSSKTVAANLTAEDDPMDGSGAASRLPVAAAASQLDVKLTLLRSTIATQIPLRLLAPILSEQSLLASDELEYKMRIKYVEFYMQIVRMALKNASHEDLLANIKAIRTMFMNLFDLRTNLLKSNSSFSSKKLAKKFDAYVTNELCNYENYILNTFCEFTFKLSEDLFRPIFFKLFEWSSANNPPKDRLITFYRCTFRLSDKLKSLFVLFAPQFVQNAADLLNQLNSSKTEEKFFESKSHSKEQLLLYNIVDTLSNVFLNDTQRTFVNKQRFNLLMEPLVDQIENEIDYDNYSQFINEHLAPCIGNFASCCNNDDSLVRKFNYQILLKTKHSSVQVRIATLDILNVFSKKIGDIYNSYLAETVPFLAELMEDPVEEVEEKVQFLIKELEDMLGESLQSHFV